MTLIKFSKKKKKWPKKKKKKKNRSFEASNLFQISILLYLIIHPIVP